MDTPTTRRIDVFGTRADYLPVVQRVEEQVSVQYVLYGLFEQPVLKVVSSGEQLDDLGISQTGSSIRDHRYGVFPSETPLKLVEVPQRRGGMRYEIDPALNSIAVGFQPGGVFGSNCIIAGQIGVSKRSLPEAHHFYDLFVRAVKAHFIRMNGSFVGKAAFRLSKAGYRLTKEAAMTSWDMKPSVHRHM